MQLFLHILKMTWLTVASGLDIIHHQDRTGEASAGKLKFWEGEELKDLQLNLMVPLGNQGVCWSKWRGS